MDLHHLFGRLKHFTTVGAASTFAYAALAWALAAAVPNSTWISSALAYTLAALVSYLGHRSLTFVTDQPHRETVPRFAALSLVGYGIAIVAPWILTDTLGAHPLVAIGTSCILIPFMSALMLSRVVFCIPLLGSGDLGRSEGRL